MVSSDQHFMHPIKKFLSSDWAWPKDPKMRCSTCVYGRGPGTKMFICSHCLQAQYCGVECQRADWSEHKNTCKASMRATTPSVFSSVEGKQGIPASFEFFCIFLQAKASDRSLCETAIRGDSAFRKLITRFFKSKDLLEETIRAYSLASTLVQIGHPCSIESPSGIYIVFATFLPFLIIETAMQEAMILIRSSPPAYEVASKASKQLSSTINRIEETVEQIRQVIVRFELALQARS